MRNFTATVKERAQISNTAPALITFGYIIATENKAVAVKADDIIELIEKRYGVDAEK